MARRAASLQTSSMRPKVSQKASEVTAWVLCGLSAVFLASRFAVRWWKKGRLRKSDYALIICLPCLFVSVGLLQTALTELYVLWSEAPAHQAKDLDLQSGAALRLTSAIELLWIAIYAVKISFLAQFKFHKPPYAYVSPRLTQYYWVAISICALAFMFTLIVPPVLCPRSANCRYFQPPNTIAWEVSLTALDIITDLLVVSIPVSLIWMANFTLSRAFINTCFKSLSILMVAIAITRLALQYRKEYHDVDYIILTYWLVVEAAVAVIAASLSAYRIVVLDLISIYEIDQPLNPTQPRTRQLLGLWRLKCRKEVAKIVALLRLDSLSKLSIQRYASSSPATR